MGEAFEQAQEFKVRGILNVHLIISQPNMKKTHTWQLHV
jgi:hypothetical protein